MKDMPPTRRNLFQSHLSRRPASGVPSSSNSTSSSTSTNNHTDSTTSTATNNNIISPLNPNVINPLSSEAVQMTLSANFAASSSSSPPPPTIAVIDDGEIIARDKNGRFQLDIPVLPPTPLDEDEEDEEERDEEDDEGAMEGIEEDDVNVSRSSAAGPSGNNAVSGPAIGPGLVGRDKEKLEAGLVEMMYRNRNRHLSGEPEILNLIQQSLRSKVAALDEDGWMFEMEDDPHV